MIVSVNI